MAEIRVALAEPFGYRTTMHTDVKLPANILVPGAAAQPNPSANTTVGRQAVFGKTSHHVDVEKTLPYIPSITNGRLLMRNFSSTFT